MEIRDGLVQGLGRKFMQHLLKASDADGTLKKILFIARVLQTQAVFNEIIGAPVFPLFIPVKVIAGQGGDKVKIFPRIQTALGEETGDGDHILHQSRDIVKSDLIDPLKDIANACIGRDQVGTVDMPVTIGFTGDRLSLKLKMVNGSFHDIIKITDESGTYNAFGA